MSPHETLLVRAGRVIDPASGIDRIADVLVRGGRIAAIGTDLPVDPDAVYVLEASGRIVCPGLVDLHTHLRYPGFLEKETMESGTAAAAAGGFTTVCAMANTDPVVDSVDVLDIVKAEAERVAPVRVRQLAAVTYGLEGKGLTDLDALSGAGAVAFSDDGKPVWNAGLMRAALQASARLGKPISAHEEDPATVRGGVANAGVAERLGLAPWPCRGEAVMVARDLALLEEVGGHLHVAHVSCADTLPLLREARARGLHVTAEVTPHHLRLSDRFLRGDEDLGLHPAHPCTKVNPPLRSEADVAAVVEALRDGIIDAVATDHAPHSDADKAGPFATAAFGFTGIETALPLLLALVAERKLSLSTAIERLTAGPARVFGLEGGTLRPGVPADVCIFDPDARWRPTPDTLFSKGKNTPLLGTELRGKVVHTVVGGTVVYSAG